ncbi:hypothetical protein HMPREF1550_02106 [Actinomyces sp. oral taxon 877 str. F0543]|nr:hypothetical protein HMPREF1550_02106 [Actinomyces sp. oral taxon 877 str. F0543]
MRPPPFSLVMPGSRVFWGSEPLTVTIPSLDPPDALEPPPPPLHAVSASAAAAGTASQAFFRFMEMPSYVDGAV